jgi:hypothetical protein
MRRKKMSKDRTIAKLLFILSRVRYAMHAMNIDPNNPDFELLQWEKEDLEEDISKILKKYGE